MNRVDSVKMSVLPMLIYQQVLKDIISLIAALGIRDPVLVAAMAALVQAYNDLDAAMNRALGSNNTRQLLLLDDQRDNVINGLEMVLRGYELSTIPAKAQAARILLRYLEAYGEHIDRQPQIQETSSINNLLQDFGKVDAVAAIAQIPALTADWITPLQTANTQFEALYSTRAADLQVADVGAAKRLRGVAQQRLEDYVNKLNSTLTLAATPDPAQVKAVNIINTEVATAKTNVKKGNNQGGAVTPPPPNA